MSTTRQHRGFATLTPQRRREIASLGGKAAHECGRAYRWTSEAAQEAGKRGRAKALANRRA